MCKVNTNTSWDDSTLGDLSVARSPEPAFEAGRTQVRTPGVHKCTPAPLEYAGEAEDITRQRRSDSEQPMAETNLTPTGTQSLKVNEKKWTVPLMKAGWSAFPSIILEKQKALGLDALDINIIMHLVQYWWEPGNHPHPSVGTIADAIQVTERTVQKRIKALQDLGLITREERRFTKQGSMTNLYKFDGLIEQATPYALEKLEEIEKAKAAKKERLARKKPQLTLVPKA